MRNIRAFAGCLAAWLAATAAAPTSEPAVEEAWAVLRAQTAAWNRGDVEAFCSVYAEDATFVSPSGVTRGRQQVVERYRRRYPDAAAMGTLVLEPVDARAMPAPTPDLHPAGVSLAARWRLSYPDKPEASGYTLLVLHRVHDRWLIMQDASF